MPVNGGKNWRRDAECPTTCLNRLAPSCVIHRPAEEEDRRWTNMMRGGGYQ